MFAKQMNLTGTLPGIVPVLVAFAAILIRMKNVMLRPMEASVKRK